MGRRRQDSPDGASKSGWASEPEGALPLAGIRIVEAIDPAAPDALVCAAGLCGRIAADLGAQVTRISSPSTEPSATGLFLHGGKRDSTEAAAWLIPQCDAVVLDAATYEAVEGRCGEAIVVVIGMSADSPSQGSEFTIEARSGLLDLVGDAAREPLRLGGHQTAYAAGLAAYLGLVSALTRRDAGLPSGPVRVDLLDAAVWLNWKTLALALRSGTVPRRAGPDSEWTVVPCADGHAALVYRVQEWKVLQAAFGDPRLTEPRFATPALRRRNRSALNAILAELLAPMTRAEIRIFSLAHKLPLGPVWTPEEIRADPHMQARAFFAAVPGNGATVAMPCLPVKWNGRAVTPAAIAADLVAERAGE
jgi:crotonobetainyl-CoA:carnitine CoA-transferase CaiB-like acyl-CoA transferase